MTSHTAVRNEPAVVFAVDRDGVFTLSRGRGLGVLGLKEGELVGQSAFDVYRRVPAILQNLRRVLAGEAFSSFVEVAGVTFECSYDPLRDREGAVIGAAGVAVDLGQSFRAVQRPPDRGAQVRKHGRPEGLVTNGGEVEFGELVESLPDLVTVADLDGRILYVNPAVEGMLGYFPEEFVGVASDLAELTEKIIHPEDRALALRELAKAAKKPEVCRPVTVRARHKDGSWRHVEGYIDGLPDDPDARRLVIVSHDITERVRAEEEARCLNKRLETMVEERTARLEAMVAQVEENGRAMRESEERFRLVARTIKEAIWDNDLVADRQVWDGAVEDVLGYPPEQVTDTAWWGERVHPEDGERVLSKVEDVLRGDADTWSDEYRFRHADGSYVFVVDRGYVVRDEASGEPIRLLGSMMDVTERKRAEERLRKSEERYRLAFDRAPVSMAHIAPNGRFLRVNDRFCELSGYGREELLETFWPALTPPEELEGCMDRFSQALEGRLCAYSVERRCIRKDGSRVWIEVSASLVRQPSGEPEYFVCVADDVTERKLAELIPDPLTSREMEVLQGIAAGKANPQIAEDLRQSLGTVKLDARHILAKLETKTRDGAAARAVEIGLIPPPPT